MPQDEKIICYLGPSLPLYRAVELCPNMIFRPPARQGDILSDAVEVQPERILLIDGEFLQNLSVWHKELVFALSKEIKVYGAASMGALRAADLWRQGMIGAGEIFRWYRDGLTEDDSEVALLYHRDLKGVYQSVTIPLVDIRATLWHYAEMLAISVDIQEALLSAARAIHFTLRAEMALLAAWIPILGENTAAFLVNNLISQKYLDAEWLLTNYQTLQQDPQSVKPTDKSLSKFFWAQYDRDRLVTVSSTRVAQQNIEGYVALNAIDYPQIFWDAKNFHLTHKLAEMLGVQVAELDVEVEQQRFLMRHNLTGMGEIENWIRQNNLTIGEFLLLMIKMATVRKLHHWLASSLVPIESTKLTLDYLKIHNSYIYWAKECVEKESKIQARKVDDTLLINAAKPVEVQLNEHCQKTGLTVDGSVEDFVTETGFSTRYELGVALERLKAVE